jgi:hypothetical protein
MSESKEQVYIETYSDKSFVVRGDTRPHKESLKRMGGKWVNRLTDKKSGDKFGAWLFWTEKREEVSEWVSKGCASQTFIQERKISLTPEELSNLIKRITKLEKVVEKMSKQWGIDMSSSEEEIVTEDVSPPPQHKRLLRAQ